MPPRGNRTSLLVRNIPMDCRPDELRAMFTRYGDVRDCYMPRDYYTGKPRGFGFVEFLDPRDAEDAMYALDKSFVGGREIQVCLSKEDRKTPREMVHRDEMSNPRARGGRGARSPPRRRDSSRDRGYYRRDYDRDRAYSRGRDRSPVERGRSRRARTPSVSRSRSRSISRSPAGRQAASRSVSRSKSRSPSRSKSRSRSRSPPPAKRDASRSASRSRSRSASRSPARSGSPRRSASRSPTPQ
ncbi:hypothetical protein DUNSADRAFT_13248 [Dunaliella salina]|uniref:RRM domain-containing protein n=1 Tax=Dunaliella salina TaxID=3046 RepID=A0ABQ7H3F6_DUNSA|nr:hypothetical protein DUNSADRAFT_13248 [Dunaliella salina]|eukprot:KAF5841380.1 hypothetical protein DUNSADRAFT_13248 [Dunaliella salina]